MPFISLQELPPSYLKNKRYKLLEDLCNMSGKFEKDTEMTCISVTKRGSLPDPVAVTLADKHDNRILLNWIMFTKTTIPVTESH